MRATLDWRDAVRGSGLLRLRDGASIRGLRGNRFPDNFVSGSVGAFHARHLVFELVFVLAFVAWGIASGIGLLQLRQWARISTIVFSAIMIFFCAFPMLIFLFVPLSPPEGASANFEPIFRVFIELFYGFFVALGIFWIWFFNRKSIKEQFRAASGSASGVTELSRQRPVAITIVAWILITSGCFMPIVLPMRMPALLFGSMLPRAWGDAFYMAFAVICIVAAIGLLKLRRWAWILAVCIQGFGILNGALTLLLPGGLARLQAAALMQERAMNLPEQPTLVPPTAMIWTGFGSGLAFVIAILVVLLLYRGAFKENSAVSSQTAI